MNTKLYVGNLSFNTSEATLQSTFEAHGSVHDVTIINDRDTGRPRGFAFVTMGQKDEAEAAITALDGFNLDGRNLTVNEAKSREEQGQNRFRGGDRYGSRY